MKTTVIRALSLACAGALWAVTTSAQTSEPSSTPATQEATRPATTTFYGDTGLWYVPTAEVLAHGKWSTSGYRRGTNWVQGYTNVADFAGTFAIGVKDRAEVFGSFLVDTRIDRDIRPLFVSDPAIGGVVDRYPLVHEPWTGDNLGDLFLGVKYGVWSEFRQNPAAIAIRGIVKVPTADKDKGLGTGKTDMAIDAIVSKEAGMSEVSAYAGWEFRGSPDNFDGPTGALRWGAGVAVPARKFLRFTGELNGVMPNKDDITFKGVTIQCVDCGAMPLVSKTENLTRATVGLTLQSASGLFGSVGASWNVPMTARTSAFNPEGDVTGDYFDWQFRIGYHPGTRVYESPPPPAAPPPPPMAPQNRPPVVQARCEPCTVQVGKSSTVTADASDPDGDTLAYRWSAPAGTFQNPADRQTLWTAPMQEGPVQTTVTVNDGKGGTASASVTIQVVGAAPVIELNFEDVYFDFDRSTLRPEALRLLDDAVTKLQANPGRNIVIEGHTCNIGTAEYNLALGDRRAASVRDYLASRGVSSGRLEIRSYGEERPKFDNDREETRRLNRRAALVVKVQ